MDHFNVTPTVVAAQHSNLRSINQYADLTDFRRIDTTSWVTSCNMRRSQPRTAHLACGGGVVCYILSAYNIRSTGRMHNRSMKSKTALYSCDLPYAAKSQQCSAKALAQRRLQYNPLLCPTRVI